MNEVTTCFLDRVSGHVVMDVEGWVTIPVSWEAMLKGEAGAECGLDSAGIFNHTVGS